MKFFFKKIDGMIYGDKPDEVFFQRIGLSIKLDFTFNFDENFYFLNNPNFLLGLTDKETKVVFDIDKTSKKNDLEYLSAWMKVRKKNTRL